MLAMLLFCPLATSCNNAQFVDAESDLAQRIGHHVKSLGLAHETSDYGASIMHGDRHVYIEGMPSWPLGVSGKLVVVSGILDAPFNPAGSGVGGPGLPDSFVLKETSWQLAEE